MKEVILHYEDKYIPMERKDTRMTLPMKKVALSLIHIYLDELESERKSWGLFRDRRPEMYGEK